MKEGLFRLYVVYYNVNIKMYISVMMGLLLSSNLRKVFICDIILYDFFMYINEIVIEKEVFKNIFGIIGKLIIFFLVVLYLFFVFNYYKLGDVVKL